MLFPAKTPQYHDEFLIKRKKVKTRPVRKIVVIPKNAAITPNAE